MKKEFECMQADLFLVTGTNVVIQWREPYKVRKEIIETSNFLPEGFLIGSLLNEKRRAGDEKYMTLREGEIAMADTICTENNGLIRLDSFLKEPGLPYKLEDDGGDEEDWDEEDEDWDDEEDEDWDEDEEEWDEDEDWDEEEEDEEDEDWDEEEEEEK